MQKKKICVKNLCACSYDSKVMWTVWVFGSLLATASHSSTLPYCFNNGSTSLKFAWCGIPLMTTFVVELSEKKKEKEKNNEEKNFLFAVNWT